MNKIYKVVFSKRTGTFVVASELAKSVGKAVSTIGLIALIDMSLPLDLSSIRNANAQTLPEAACTAGSGGTMYGGSSTCVNYVNNTRIYLNSLSTSTSTAVSSLSTGVSSLSTGLSSLSTSTSTAVSSLSTDISSLSTSTSTAVSSLSTGVSSLSTGVSSLSTGLSSLSTSTSTTASVYQLVSIV